MAAPKGSPKRGGRKAGVPNKATGDIKEFALTFTREAIEGLVSIARNDQAGFAARVNAWDKVLDRAVGKAPQAITGDNGGPIDIRFSFKLDKANGDN